MIDLGRLRALHAVAQYGSVNRAAEVLGYTPSAVLPPRNAAFACPIPNLSARRS